MRKRIRTLYFLIPLFAILAFQNCGYSGPSGSTSAVDSSPSFVLDATPAPSPEHSYFVSLQGSDTATGTITTPLRTISEALSRYRSLRSTLAADFHILIREGVYELEAPLIISEADSGPIGFRLLIKAYQSEKVVLSGGTSFSQFDLSKTTDKGFIFYKYIGHNFNFRQIYLEGSTSRPHRARFPNQNSYLISDWRKLNPNYDEIESHILPHNAIFSRNFEGSELVMLETHRQTRYPVKTVRGDSSGITVTASETASRYKKDLIMMEGSTSELSLRFRSYFENSKDFIDVPTEWFYSAQDGILLYMAPTSSFGQTIVVPRLERLLEIKGLPEDPVKRVTFEGLEFRHTTWNAPSIDGYASIQTGVFSAIANDVGFRSQVPGGIVIEQARDITISKSRISDMGGAGLVLKKGLERIFINDNFFTNISGNGIASQNMCRYPDRNADPNFPDCAGSSLLESHLTRNVRISGNIIQRVAQDFEGVGIFFPRGKDIEIDRNTLQYLPYGAIAIGFWFQRALDAFSGIHVTSNEIWHSMLLYDDGGAIYFNGDKSSCEQQRNGVTIQSNLIDQVVARVNSPLNSSASGPTIAIYLDGGACKALVTDNHFRNVSNALMLQELAGSEATGNTIYGNRFQYIYRALFPFSTLERRNELMSRNQVGDPLNSMTGEFLGTPLPVTSEFLSRIGAPASLKQKWQLEMAPSESDPKITSNNLDRP